MNKLYPDLSIFYDNSFVDFDVIDINDDKHEITCMVSNLGKVSMITYDLKEDKNKCNYFEYGIYNQRVYLDE